MLVAEEGVVVEEVDPSHPLEADRILFRTLFAAVTLRVCMLRVVEAHEEDVDLDNDGSVKRREQGARVGLGYLVVLVLTDPDVLRFHSWREAPVFLQMGGGGRCRARHLRGEDSLASGEICRSRTLVDEELDDRTAVACKRTDVDGCRLEVNK